MSDDKRRTLTRFEIKKMLADSRERRQRREAAGFLGSALDWLVRNAAAPSTRTPGAIASDVKTFFNRRPRPWRWHGSK